MGKQLQKKENLLCGLFTVLVVICFLGTAGQTLTRLSSHPLLEAGWWLLKVISAAVAVLVPIMLGGYQERPRKRIGTTILIWIIGVLTFSVARYTSQPLAQGASSPELFVVQNIFVTWLAGSLLYLFAVPLQAFLHRWPITIRRRFLLGSTLFFFLLRFIGSYDLLGFHGGTSLVWFFYLFALGDWLANDRDWLKKWSTGWYAALTAFSLLMTIVAAWLNMNHVIYSPHHGLTPNTHYLLAINACQPLFVITCLLIMGWLVRSGHLAWINDCYLVRGLLLLNLLGLPQAVTPLLLPQINKVGIAVSALLILCLLLWLPSILTYWGGKREITINWHSIMAWLRSFCLHYWPLAATYLVFWLMTVASFAILWGE